MECKIRKWEVGDPRSQKLLKKKKSRIKFKTEERRTGRKAERQKEDRDTQITKVKNKKRDTSLLNLQKFKGLQGNTINNYMPINQTTQMKCSNSWKNTNYQNQLNKK